MLLHISPCRIPGLISDFLVAKYTMGGECYVTCNDPTDVKKITIQQLTGIMPTTAPKATVDLIIQCQYMITAPISGADGCSIMGKLACCREF
jgi:hypothetical protein